MNLQDYLHDLSRIWPEILLSVTALLALVCDLLQRGKDPRVTGWVTAIGVLFTLGWICRDVGLADGSLVFGMIVHDRFAMFFKLLICAGTLVVTLLSLFFRGFQRDGIGEYYSILAIAAVGAMFMVSTNNLLLLFLALETLSISSYALAGFLKRDARSSEAALKYLVFGVLASGAMLYGFSLLYGYAGSLDLREIAAAIRTHLHVGEHGLSPAGIGCGIAVVLCLAGFGYKVAAFPFHFWSPDVYEGAPTPVTTFLAVVSKIASVGMILRFFGGIPHDGEGAAPLAAVIAALAACSMTFGNLGALMQQNAKRLLAYSSIAHSGYLLAGVAALVAPSAAAGLAHGATAGEAHGAATGLAHLAVGGITGGQAVAFYAAAYLLMNLGAFGVVIYLSNRFGTESIDGFAGLGWKAPVACGTLVLFLLSLTGIPPTVGFVGKWYLLQPIWSKGMHWLAVVLVLNSVISLFYYFRLARSLFLVDASKALASPRKHAFGTELTVVAVTLAVGVVWFGIKFEWLSDLVLSLRV
ncbi:MAG: NADH-quinone oxidoreductase subunit N [Planctomycetes bacterium]|nr:NADH-quinone oxidoreductase subunit N [Planctomycetota bacterium]